MPTNLQELEKGKKQAQDMFDAAVAKETMFLLSYIIFLCLIKVLLGSYLLVSVYSM
jgi:hypothetical protein